MDQYKDGDFPQIDFDNNIFYGYFRFEDPDMVSNGHNRAPQG